MSRSVVFIFHRPAHDGDSPLVRLLATVREELAMRQSKLFRQAGADEVRLPSDLDAAAAFGEIVADLAPARGGVILMGSGAVPLLNRSDAERLVSVASSGQRRALTNNRYSSDICAVGNGSVLRRLPALPGDNALPRWLEERAEFAVDELPARERLALDIDGPLDVALVALHPLAPDVLRQAARRAGLTVPRRDELRALAGDPHRELLVFGRAGARTLRWLERNVRCRVRFLAEERGLRASSPLAIGGLPTADETRPPRATLGLLLGQGGPGALEQVVSDLADGAVLDSRVLLAHRLGADERLWPPPADRFASDLHRFDEVSDSWLRKLTVSAARSRLPIVLGAHSLVGPGMRLLLGRRVAD